MKTKPITYLKQIVPCILWLCLAIAAHAQGIFQAALGTPPDDGARLFLGNFYFRVVDDQVEFKAFVSPSTFTSSLDPVLSVPGSSIEFSLGEGSYAQLGFNNRNPFLPPIPPTPAGYDDDGNPYYFTLPGFIPAFVYTGRFALPQGFLEELLAGNGTVELNSFIGGNINVEAVPEPAAMELGLMAAGALLLRRKKRTR